MKEWYSFGMTSDELYDRLLVFAKDCQMLVVKLPNNSYNVVYSSQLIRSSSSPGANYIEALEASSKKDFIHRLKICRKEARESIHWLLLIQAANKGDMETNKKINNLISEARQFINIFTASILTSEVNQKINK